MRLCNQRCQRETEVSPLCLYQRIKRCSIPTEGRLAKECQAGRIKKLEAKLQRFTEERDILERVSRFFARQSG